VPFLEGENLLALGQAREAIAQYRRALELSPTSEQAAMGLGHAAYRAGDNDQAIKPTAGARAQSANYIVRLALAKVYMGLNRFEEAAKEQQTVLAAHPRFAPAHLDYGVTLVRLRRYDKRGRHWRKAVELGSKTAYTYNFLGNAYLSSGRSTDASTLTRRRFASTELRHGLLNLAVSTSTPANPTSRLTTKKACRLDRELADNSNRSSIKRDAPARAGITSPDTFDRLEVKLDAEAAPAGRASARP